MTTSKTPNMLDYEAERRTFHLEVPEYFNFATDVIGKWAQDPNRLAILTRPLGSTGLWASVIELEMYKVKLRSLHSDFTTT